MISTTTALAFLGAPATDSDLVAGIVERASAMLERDLGFYLGTPAAREHRADGSRYGFPLLCEIIVPDDVLEPTEEAPIVIAYLTHDWEWSTIPTTKWRRDGRRFFHRDGFPCTERRGIRISYRSGWAVDTGPAELRDVVLMLTQTRYTDAHAQGIQSETLSDYSYTLKSGTELATAYADVVTRYRRRSPVGY